MFKGEKWIPLESKNMIESIVELHVTFPSGSIKAIFANPLWCLSNIREHIHIMVDNDFPKASFKMNGRKGNQSYVVSILTHFNGCVVLVEVFY